MIFFDNSKLFYDYQSKKPRSMTIVIMHFVLLLRKARASLKK